MQYRNIIFAAALALTSTLASGYTITPYGSDLEVRDLFARGKTPSKAPSKAPAKAATPSALKVAPSSGIAKKPIVGPSGITQHSKGGRQGTPPPQGLSGAHTDYTQKKIIASYGNNLKNHAANKLTHPDATTTAYMPHQGTPADRKAATDANRKAATAPLKKDGSKGVRDEFPWASTKYTGKSIVAYMPKVESEVEKYLMKSANSQSRKTGFPVQFKDNRTKRSIMARAAEAEAELYIRDLVEELAARDAMYDYEGYGDVYARDAEPEFDYGFDSDIYARDADFDYGMEADLWRRQDILDAWGVVDN